MKSFTPFTALLLLSVSVPGQAEDITGSPDLLAQQNRTRLQTQVQSLSSEERALYQQLNHEARSGTGGQEGSGERKRTRDGSGNGSGKKKRSGYSSQQSFEAGYGTGYRTRQGNYGRR